MQLPKNVTQIGEPDQHCKIYVEDYVISYLKQLNVSAGDKAVTVGLYGTRKEEAGVTYLFFYGACRLNFLERESRHLSQAVLQEAEELRRKYFSQYTFLGYRLLNGEMVEGFHVCEQGVCRYIEGYARFYEKNDTMLAFMLADRKEAPKPEEFNQEKYDRVKKRQEERRKQSDEQGGQAGSIQSGEESLRSRMGAPKKRVRLNSARAMKNMKYTAAAAFAILLVAGYAMINGGNGLSDLRQAAGRMVDNVTTKQLPDSMEDGNNSTQAGSIVTEGKLTDALLKENADAVQAANGNDITLPSAVTGTSSPEATPEPSSEAIPETTPETTPEPTPETTPEMTPEPTPEATPEPTSEPTPEPVSYTIRRGDTLIGICLARYGSDKMVSEICSMNNIENPDDIKEGQKILLP